MKAVLMNSADKIKDDGQTILNGESIPRGALLGMEKTITDTNNNNWFSSPAYDDSIDGNGSLIPKDMQMGTGALNANRALQQFRSGQYSTGTVPLIGWDYGHTTGAGNLQKYSLSQALPAKSFISVTLAWDRRISFDHDGGTSNVFDNGDTFNASMATSADADNDDQINDLDIWLLPAGSFSLSDAIAHSGSPVGTLEHLFFQIPTSGQYDFWIEQRHEGVEDFPDGQDYGVAWWATSVIGGVTIDDFNGNGVVDAADYGVWRTDFGSNNASADANGDGVVDTADYVVWRDHLGQSVGSGASGVASVPEPSVAVFLSMVLAFAMSVRMRLK